MRKIDDKLKNKASEILKQMNEFAAQNDGKIFVDKDRITQTRKYKLITPLFGGGVSPRENDVSKLIRETSIRGQLRFWWRAMRGNGSLAEMKEREDAIFGSGGEKGAQSQIKICVKIDSNGDPRDFYKIQGNYANFSDKNEVLNYTLFSLPQTEKELNNQRENNEEIKEFSLQENIKFSLEVSYPQQYEQDIKATIWAWETFGGIGGRTRRGFGSVQPLDENDLPDSQSVENWIIDKLKIHSDTERINEEFEFPILSNNLQFKISRNFVLNEKDKNKNPNNHFLEALRFGIKQLYGFRQFRLKEKDQFGNRITPVPDKHGISQWSEADALRYLVLDDTKPKVIKFPRSEFGLPINFYFETPKEDKRDFTKINKEGKPEVKLTAKADEIDRLASPLILRPIQCANGEAVVIALILQTPRQPKGGLKLDKTKLPLSKTELPANAGTLEVDEFTILAEEGLEPLRGKTDVLQAFLDFFANDGADNQNRNNNQRNDRSR